MKGLFLDLPPRKNCEKNQLWNLLFWSRDKQVLCSATSEKVEKSRNLDYVLRQKMTLKHGTSEWIQQQFSLKHGVNHYGCSSPSGNLNFNYPVITSCHNWSIWYFCLFIFRVRRRKLGKRRKDSIKMRKCFVISWSIFSDFETCE